MSKTRKALFITLVILAVGVLLFIWGNSCLSVDESSNASSSVYDVVYPIFKAVFSPLENLFGIEIVTQAFIRKCAHCFEFFCFSLLLNLIYITAGRYNLKTALGATLSGLVVAVVDETIQIFSSRGPAVTDVLIDLLGVIIATAICLLVVYIVRKVKRNKQKKKEVQSE